MKLWIIHTLVWVLDVNSIFFQQNYLMRTENLPYLVAIIYTFYVMSPNYCINYGTFNHHATTSWLIGSQKYWLVNNPQKIMLLKWLKLCKVMGVLVPSLLYEGDF